jgi:hypothetical protein
VSWNPFRTSYGGMMAAARGVADAPHTTSMRPTRMAGVTMLSGAPGTAGSAQRNQRSQHRRSRGGCDGPLVAHQAGDVTRRPPPSAAPPACVPTTCTIAHPTCVAHRRPTAPCRTPIPRALVHLPAVCSVCRRTRDLCRHRLKSDPLSPGGFQYSSQRPCYLRGVWSWGDGDVSGSWRSRTSTGS